VISLVFFGLGVSGVIGQPGGGGHQHATGTQTQATTPSVQQIAHRRLTYFVLDVSQRMKFGFPEQPIPSKLDRAKSWIRVKHNALLRDTDTALRIFGNGTSQHCNSWTSRYIPRRQQYQNRRFFKQDVPKLHPARGLAPLSNAVIQAANDLLRWSNQDDGVRLIVITGGDDTCWTPYWRAQALKEVCGVKADVQTYILAAEPPHRIESQKQQFDSFVSTLRKCHFHPSVITAVNTDGFDAGLDYMEKYAIG
jgi:hypothetical protein